MSIFFILSFLILFFILLVPSILLSVITRILNLFRFGSRKSAEGATHREYHYTSNGPRREDPSHEEKSRSTKKIFDKDEGEYVDFEEIKD